MAIAKVTTDILGATGLPGASVHYFTIAGTTATTAEATDVCARVRAFWNGLAAYLAVGIQCVVDPTVDALDVPSGALQGRTTGTTPATVTGTGVDTLPRQTMVGCRYLTNVVLNRRSLQGRTFIGPLGTTSATAAGIPVAALKTQTTTSGGRLATGGPAATP